MARNTPSSFFFIGRVVGDRSEQRRDHRDDQDRPRRRPGEPARRHRPGQTGGGDLLEEDREDRRDDRRLEGGVRPVVHRPGAQVAPAEPEAGRGGSCQAHQYVRRATHSRSNESTTM